MVIFPLYHSGWDFEWWKGEGAGGGVKTGTEESKKENHYL